MTMETLKSEQTCEIYNYDHGTNVGQRQIWVPDGNRTHDLPSILRAVALPTELQELMESEAILLSSYLTRALQTARISIVDKAYCLMINKGCKF